VPEDVPLAAAVAVASTAGVAGPASTASPGSLARRNVWEGSLRRWDAYDAMVLGATVLIVTALDPPWAALAVAALLAMAPWYVLVGRAAMIAGGDRPWRAAVYLTGLFGLLLTADMAGGTVTFILLALCPQCFMAARFRWAVVAVTVLNATPLISAVTLGDRGRSLLALTAISAIGIAFSITFGSWILKIIDQSAERAELIDQLESTRAELAAAHREAGVLAERQRISAEIHDTIAQGSASLVMLLEAADASLAADPGAARHHLRLAAQTARDNLAEARGLVAGLSPALDGGTLDDALRRVAERARGQDGIAADVEITGMARPLGTAVEVVLLRACQEAMANVRKHAGASRATISLAYGAAEVRLVVTDDGGGFDPAAVTAGYGLRGMRARVAEAGGAVCVRSAPREGTALTVTVPA
jgi:signal transduction histidine kinase